MFRSNEITEEVLEELRGLRREVAELAGERDALRKDRDLSKQVLSLREEIERLKIEKSRVTEEREREGREVNHKIGLERKRMEVEKDLVQRETSVKVREENLQADRERFEKQMDFMTTRFGQEVGYLKEIMLDILKRLPTVNASITERVGAVVGNGSKTDGDD